MSGNLSVRSLKPDWPAWNNVSSIRGAGQIDRDVDNLTILSAIMRGIEVSPEWEKTPENLSQLVQSATFHGVLPLVLHRLYTTQERFPWADELLQGYPDKQRNALAVELARQRELMAVLQALADRDVRVVLMKGTPLAFTHYVSPILRGRADTDLFVRESDCAAIRQVVYELGYCSPNAVSGDILSYQSCYRKQDGNGLEHNLDVHWKISNSQLFARMLSFSEVEKASKAVPALGKNGYALNK